MNPDEFEDISQPPPPGGGLFDPTLRPSGAEPQTEFAPERTPANGPNRRQPHRRQPDARQAAQHDAEQQERAILGPQETAQRAEGEGEEFTHGEPFRGQRATHRCPDVPCLVAPC